MWCVQRKAFISAHFVDFLAKQWYLQLFYLSTLLPTSIITQIVFKM